MSKCQTIMCQNKGNSKVNGILLCSDHETMLKETRSLITNEGLLLIDLDGQGVLVL